jgi:hypothetical protein
MAGTNKEQVFLEVTADLVKFYTFMAHAVRVLTESTPSGQITLQQVEGQLRETRESLAPRLANNPVVLKKIEADYLRVSNLMEGFKRGGERNSPEREALIRDGATLRAYAQEKAACFSDLVAIFRSL